jgi:hypothetical protein
MTTLNYAGGGAGFAGGRDVLPLGEGFYGLFTAVGAAKIPHF